MSKLGKVCLATLVCGLLLVGGAWLMGLRDFSLGGTSMENEVKEIPLDTLRAVDIQLELQQVEIREGGTKTVLYYPAYSDPALRLQVKQEDGKLTISGPKQKAKVQIAIPNFFPSVLDKQKVVLNVAKGEKIDNISIDLSVGSVALYKVRTENAAIRTKLGSMKMDHCTMEHLDAQSETGSIWIADTALSTSSISTNTGSISAAIKPSGTIDLRTNTGAIVVDTFGVKRTNVTMETGTGRVRWQRDTQRFNTFHHEVDDAQATLFLHSDTGNLAVIDLEEETRRINEERKNSQANGTSTSKSERSQADSQE